MRIPTRSLLLLLVPLLLQRSPVSAQARPVTWSSADAVAARLATDDSTAVGEGQVGGDAAGPRPLDRFVVRTLAGGAGWVTGALLGAVVGHSTACASCGSRDWEGILTGALLGGIAGTAALAAAPSMGDGCSYGGRLAVGLLGSGAGTVIGGLAAWATDGPILIPVFTAGGGAAATLYCRRRTR